MADCLTAPSTSKMELAASASSSPFVEVFHQSGAGGSQESPESPQASSDSAERNSSFNSMSASNVTEEALHISDEDEETQVNHLLASSDISREDMLDGCLEGNGAEKDEGVCGICQKEYNQPPRVLNCLHVFCETCLAQQRRPNTSSPALASAVVQSNSIICCPTCHDETECSQGIKGLPLDYVLINRIDAEAIKKRTVICTSCKSEDHAIARCQDCSSFLCASCEKAHSSMLCFENHEVVSFEVFDERRAEIHRAIQCLRHPKELVSLYDPTCGIALCNYCLVSGHQGHGCKDTREFDKVARADFKQVISECKQSLDKFDTMEEKLSSLLSELQLTRDSVRSAIEETYISYKALLEKVRDAALEDLEKKHSQQESVVMDEIQHCSEAKVHLEHSIEFSQKLAEFGNPTEFLALKLLASTRMRKLVNSCLEQSKVRELRFIPNEGSFESCVENLFGEVTAVGDYGAPGDNYSRSSAPPKISDPPKNSDLLSMNGAANRVTSTMGRSLMRNHIPSVLSNDDDKSYLRKLGNLMENSDLMGMHDTLNGPTYRRSNDLGVGNELISSNSLLRGSDLLRDPSDMMRVSSNDPIRGNDFNSIIGSSGPSDMGVSGASRLLSSDLVDAVHSTALSPPHFGRLSNTRSLIPSPPLPSLSNMGTSLRSDDSQLSDTLRSAMEHINLACLSNPSESDVDNDVLPMLVRPPPARMMGSPDMSSHLNPKQAVAVGNAASSFAALAHMDEGNLMMNISALAGLGGPRHMGGSSTSPPLPQSSSSSVNGGHRSPPQAKVTILPPTTGPQPNPMPTRNRMTPMHIRIKFGQLGSGNIQFSSPHGFCLSPNEEIVVADTNNHRIQIFDKSGEFKNEFGREGKEEGQLWYPRKVAVMKNTGTFVVCDRGNERSRMQLFTRNGEFLKKIAIRYIDIVAGLALTSDGRIVAVDSVSPTVFVISETGVLLLWFDCSEHMREPSDIAVWGSEFYICDFKGHCVVVYSECGNFLRRIGGEGLTNFPNGIDISDHGDILVGDSHGNRFHIVVFNREGQAVSEFECPYCKVSRCCGLKITSEGYVVTLAKNNHHVLILNTLYIT